MTYVTQDEALRLAKEEGKSLSVFQSKVVLAIRKRFGDDIRLSYTEPGNIWDLDMMMYFIETKDSIDIRIEKDDIKMNGGSLNLQEEIEEIIKTAVGGNNLEPLKEVVCGATYVHFKGGEYIVLSESMHTEAVGVYFVNYKSTDENNPQIYSRPREMFMDGRFQLKSLPR